MTANSAPEAPTRARDVGAIVFLVVLILFAAVIVIASFDLRPRAGLVPLVIGSPTLAGMTFFLIREIMGHRRDEATADDGEAVSDIRNARLSKLAGMAAKELEEDGVLPTDPESVQRRRVFVVWVVLVLLLAWFFNFNVAMSVGLVGIYRYARVGWIKTVLITGILVGTIYATFDVVLGVRF